METRCLGFQGHYNVDAASSDASKAGNGELHSNVDGACQQSEAYFAQVLLFGFPLTEGSQPAFHKSLAYMHPLSERGQAVISVIDQPFVAWLLGP
jgi:hypothetical protein